jgi:hypothetical protein
MTLGPTINDSSWSRREEEFRRIERRARRRHRLAQIGRLLGDSAATSAAIWGAPVFTDSVELDGSSSW